MSSVSRGNIKMAIASLRSTKMRSVLTMLGIIIGIMSVITVVGIGEGIKHQVNSQIDQLGRDLITVRAGKLVNRNAKGGIEGVNLFSGTTAAGALNQQDFKAVQQTKHVKLAVPLNIVNGNIQINGKSASSVAVVGTTPDLPTVLHQPLAYGGFFGADVSEQPNVAILGSDAADTLFHQRTPLGRSFQFLGQTFFVQGIFNQFDTNPLSLSTDFNNTVFIPSQTAAALTGNNAQLYEVLAKPNLPSQTNDVVAGISTTLQQAHHNQQQFTVLRQDESLAVTNNILDLITRLIAGVAAVSLLVGGIGIMDVMLVSVAERMHEIGIRKALGATNRQILSQFLIESTVLSMAGGLIGIILSLFVDFTLRSFTTLTPVISWQVVAIATFVSLLVGVVFGSAPALKAARKDPIDALRNE